MSAERGEWTLARSGVPTVRRGGKALVSAFDPVAEAERSVPASEADFFVLAGLGAGYLAEAVARRHPLIPVVVVEEDEAWSLEVAAHRDLSALWKANGVLLIGTAALRDWLAPFHCPVVEVVRWRPLASDWDAAVATAVAEAQAQSQVNGATFRRFLPVWERNWHKNVAPCRPVSSLEGSARGLPVVIAAAGPSLAEALPWLEQHRNRFVLIAVDTAWPALAAHGLEPDVLLVLDGQYWNARHVDRTPPERTAVVTERVGPPRAFRLAPERTYVAASSLPFLRVLEGAGWGELRTGGSVATAAWSLAVLLGAGSVSFAGLDLGYPEGLTHVPGSQFEEAVHRRSGRLRPAEGHSRALSGPGLVRRPALDGGTVLSDARMDLFRDWLAAAVAASSVPAYNLGTRGSVVPGLGRPPAGWGEDWAVSRWSPPVVPQRSLPAETPGAPWGLLERFVSDPASIPGDEWAEASRHWGAAWDAWTARALRTWTRWPSPRSLAGLKDVVRLALEWRRFEGFFSRTGFRGR